MKQNESQLKRIEKAMLEKDQGEDPDVNGDIVAYSKESLYKQLPIEEKGKRNSQELTDGEIILPP